MINHTKLPLLSIITPCFNSVKFIRGAVESVSQENYSKIEHIIIDGGSTDGTLDVLRKYPHLRMISEPDRGVYDAVNKGINLAKGLIIGWLNSDDLYERDIFYKVVQKFQKVPGLEVVVGNAVIFKQSIDGQRNILAMKRQFENGVISFGPNQRTSVSPNACFYHRKVFDKVGKFNSSYRIAGDRDFFIRLALENIKAVHLNKVTYYYRMHGDSLTFNSRKYASRTDMRPTSPLMLHLKENIAICETYLNRENIPDDVLVYCRKLHSRFTSNLAYRQLRCFTLPEAVYSIYKGCHFNIRWPIVFASYMVQKAVYVTRYIARTLSFWERKPSFTDETHI